MVIIRQKTEVLAGNAYRNFIEAIPSDFSKEQYTYILKAYMRHYSYSDTDELVQGKDVKQVEAEIIAYLIKKRQPPFNLVHSTLNTIKSCTQFKS